MQARFPKGIIHTKNNFKKSEFIVDILSEEKRKKTQDNPT